MAGRTKEGLPGKYLDIRRIGGGASGIVYRAREPELDRTVAIKVLRTDGDDAMSLRRFEREARVMGTLSSHPNIVTIFETGVTEFREPYLVMQFMEAGSASHLVSRLGRLPWQRAAAIGVAIAGALETAHRAGVVHRDVKPSNILFQGNGEPALADFGVAHLSDVTVTAEDLLSATPAHVPPEVLWGRPSDARSDVYSLASTLYELVAGAPAFTYGEVSLPILLRRIEVDVPTRPSDLPDGFWQALERAMSKEPDARHQRAVRFGAVLREVLEEEGQPSPAMLLDIHRAGAAGVIAAEPEPAPGTATDQKPAERASGPHLFYDGGTVALDRDVIIGRSPALHPDVLAGDAVAVEIDDHEYSFSRSHFALRTSDGIVSAIDLQSSNGTMVRKVGETTWQAMPSDHATPLDAGDSIRVGSSVFEFVETRSPTEPPSASFEFAAAIAPPVPAPSVQPTADAEPIGHYDETVFLGRVDLRDGKPDWIGPYQVVDTIAHGKTGPLYKVYDSTRGGIVALKLIEVHDSISRARLSRAAAVWLDLVHPNLLRIYTVFPPHQGTAGYILMEYVDGVALSDAPVSSAQDVARIGVQLARGLHHLHEHGVIHRELTPSNVRVHPVTLDTTLLDSGIARPLVDTQSHDITIIGEPVGPPRYMAPEQVKGAVDPRSDIFGLGALLFELATGQDANSVDPEWMVGVLETTPGLHPSLCSCIQRMLMEEPSARYQSADDVARALANMLPPEVRAVDPAHVVVTLHGINTHAKWQRAFADVAHEGGLSTRLEHWNFGHFAVWRFLTPWARLAKIGWFRSIYSREFGQLDSHAAGYPNIVVHSFGTYILGNALQRFSNIRFGKVILCGSILPRDFDWDRLIEGGQVAHVRNEYGARDIWTRLVEFFVPGTGQSGRHGFVTDHPLVEQERFDYSHSEYFEAGHMRTHWLGFIKRPVANASQLRAPRAGRVRSWPPIGAYALYLSVILLIAWLVLKLT